VKSTIAVIFLLVIFKISSAQLLIGPVAGVNYSWAKIDDPDLKDNYTVKSVVGFNAGFHTAFKVQKRFFLHTSILYSTKGRIIENTVDELYNKVVYKYIDVPITYMVDFKRTIAGGKEFKYSIGMGPTISYWMGGKGTITDKETYELGEGKTPYRIVFHEPPYSVQENQMVVEHFNRFQFGLNFTASLIFEPIPDKRIMISARYDVGHSYLSKDSNGQFKSTGYQDPLKSRNKGFRISIAYLIDLKTDQRKKGKSTSKITKKKKR
jgi:hypothetical protein